MTEEQQALLAGIQELHEALGVGTRETLAYALLELRHQGTVSDGMGGTVPSGAATTVASWAGTIRPLGTSAAEREILAQLGTAVAYVITAPLGQAINTADTVHETGSGRTFEIRGVQAGVPAIEQRIIAVEV